MIDDLDPEELRKTRRIGYYFRYSLHRSDFHDVKIGERLYGHYAAKPLYGRFTPEGRVDKSAGFNGAVAVLYVPLEAKNPGEAELLIARTLPQNIQLPTGKRNWKKINEVAVKAITKRLEENEPPVW